MIRIQSLVLLAATLTAFLPAQAQSAGGVLGIWLDQTGRAGITIAPCGVKLCGSITWLKEPLDAAGKPKRDIHNTNAEAAARPLCGLQVLANFSSDGPSAWTGGTIYDPESGKTYSSTLHLQPDDTLKVRGFVGISLFGRSQTWTRPAATLPHCL